MGRTATGSGPVTLLTTPEMTIAYTAVADGSPLNDIALIGVLGEQSLYRYAADHHGTTSFRGGPIGPKNPGHLEHEYAVWLLCRMRGALLFPGPGRTVTTTDWRFEAKKEVLLVSPYAHHRQIRLGRMWVS